VQQVDDGRHLTDTVWSNVHSIDLDALSRGRTVYLMDAGTGLRQFMTEKGFVLTLLYKPAGWIRPTLWLAGHRKNE